MELFIKDIPINYSLFHGSNEIISIQNKPTWFSEKKEYSSKYGENIYLFNTKENLKLIDICSPIFQMHYLNEINNIVHIPEDRAKYLFQLGLPNYEVQSKIMGNPNCIFTNNKDFQNTKFHLNFNNNKNRLSLTKNKISYDLIFIEMIKKIYKNYNIDGYVSSQFLPSLYHCGTLLPEICLFNLNKVSFLGKIDNNFRGGQKIKRKNNKLKSNMYEKIIENDLIKSENYIPLNIVIPKK